jgi:hypothetical protein
MIQVKHNTEKNIIIIIEKGKIKFQDKIELVKKVLPLDNSHNCVKVLHDMCEAEYDSSEFEMNKLKSLSALLSENTICIKHAAVHQSSAGTAISMMYESLDLPINYFHKIFYTKEAALQWLSDDTEL